MCNTFSTKDSSSQTKKKQINTFRCTNTVDIFGNTMAKQWFDILIPDEEFNNNFPAATLVPSKNHVLYPQRPQRYRISPLMSTRPPI